LLIKKNEESVTLEVGLLLIKRFLPKCIRSNAV